MSSLAVKIEPRAVDVRFTKEALHVVLADGKEVSVPLEWSSRLRSATEEQRKKWRSIGNGVGIQWEEVDEDISVKSLLAYQ